VPLDLGHHGIEIGIAGAEPAGEPVSAALGNAFAVGAHGKFTGFAGWENRWNAETVLAEWQETRDLGLGFCRQNNFAHAPKFSRADTAMLAKWMSAGALSPR
jgi:hypothetical protein